MSSLDALKTRKYAAKGVVVQKNADQPVAIRLRYIGTGTVTSVTIVQATSLVTITTEGTKTYLFATYTTMGALADAIKGDNIFDVKVLDVLRSAASANFLLAAALTTTTSDENANAVFDVAVDTSVAKQVATCISAERGFGSVSKGHVVKLLETVYFATLGAALLDNFQIWKRKGGVEVQILSDLSVSATKTTLTLAAGQGFISADEGGELVVVLKDGTSLADAGAFVRTVGVIE
jgi:hypothetical protein